MTSYETITIEDRGDVVALVLNRPPLNVMNIAMMREMNAALEETLGNQRAKVLVIRAAGKAFSAGVDVADHTAGKVATMMEEFYRIFALMNRFTIPIVGVVEGAALGGGCEVAVFCDMIIASEKAKFGQPEIKVGVFPPIAAVIFPRLIGRNRTLEWLMNGETMSAREAEAIGLVNRVFPAEGFQEQADAFVGKLAAQSKAILALTKRAVDASLRQPVMDALAGAGKLYLGEMMATEDAAEGLNAFLAKRPPVWKNT